MFVKHDFYIGLSDINLNKELTNVSLLRYLEDIAGMHSEMVGYCITDIDKNQKTWILLAWKVEVKKRPLVNDTLTVKTWSRKIEKFYAYRDFEVRNQYDEVVCIASSKWIFMDIPKQKISKVDEETIAAYKQEPIQVFEEQDLGKLLEPNAEIINKIEYKITKDMIDINKHLHNIYYLNIAKEVLPEEYVYMQELNEFEIMYKKEIKVGSIVKATYLKDEDYHYVIIKSEDEENLHAIIKLK